MMIFKITFSLFILLFIINCASPMSKEIKYRNDDEFLSSGEANSHEALYYTNGVMCLGLCALHIKKNSDVLLYLPARPYPYAFNIVCSPNLGFQYDGELEGEEDRWITITKKHFTNIDEFDCAGLISPMNRIEPITSKFRLFVILVHADYRPMSTPYIQGNNLVLGRFAYMTTIITNEKKWYFGKKKSYFKMPKKAKKFCLHIESYKMRNKYKCLSKK